MRVGLCAIARNEAPYIQEWVTYHLALGFDRIVIYDNESTDQGFAALCAIPEFAERILIRYWPSVRGLAQFAAYDDFLYQYGAEFDWVLILDLDEFLVLKNHDEVHAFLGGFQGVHGIAINWRMFGSSGQTAFTPGLVVEKFIYASTNDFEPNINVKTFFRPGFVSRASTHSPYFISESVFVDQNHQYIEHQEGKANVFVRKFNYKNAQINHYFTKSFEEFSIKRNRGKADHEDGHPDKYRSLAEFYANDRNEERDDAILATPAYRKLRARMKGQQMDQHESDVVYKKACQDVGFWFHSVAFGGGRFTHGHKTREHMESEAQAWRFPKDLNGKSMLDIGCADGGWSVEGLRRGARSVTAIDFQQTEGRRFLQDHKIFPEIDFRTIDIYSDEFLSLKPADFVLFAGVLYHLQDPLAALKRLRCMVRESAILETVIDETNGNQRPCATFYEDKELNNDPSNWWGPNTICLESWLRVAGFRFEKTWSHLDESSKIGRASYLLAPN